MFTSIMLDPPEVAISRTALELNDASTGIAVAQAGPDWGDSEVEQFKADLKVGSVRVDSRIPNRTVAIPLILGTTSTTYAAARDKLHQKVATLQHLGGTLRRGTSHYADVVGATLHFPDATGEAHLVEGDVLLTLECLPDFYGDEVTVAPVTSSAAVVTQIINVQGDAHARTRIKLSGTPADQHGMLWSARHSHYDAATTAQPFYQGEALTGLNGAASAVLSGASGGNALTFSLTTSIANAWVPIVSTDIVGSGSMTHKGTYRVWAMMRTTASVATSVRFVHDVGEFTQPTINDAVTFPSSNILTLLDLGEISLIPSPIGTHRWLGVIQVNGPVSGSVALDYIYLQNLDDYAGKVIGFSREDTAIGINKTSTDSTVATDSSGGTIPWLSSGPPNFALPANIPGGWSARSTLAPQASVTTQYFKVTGLGFSVPAGATIVGMRFTHDARFDTGFTSGGYPANISSSAVYALKAGVRQSSPQTFGVGGWGGNVTIPMSWGSGSSLFGGTWAPADINNAGFGFEVTLVVFNADPNVGDVTGKSSVSWVVSIANWKATVYFTLSGGFPYYQDAVVYASHSSEIRSDGCFHQGPSNTWGEIGEVIGDLPRLPAGGLEGAPVELSCLLSRGCFAEVQDISNSFTEDRTLDSKTIQVVYRPTLVFPS